MSVTFSPAADLTLPHTVSCYCEVISTHNSYAEAYAALAHTVVSCDDPYCSPMVETAIMEPEVNVSNMNAEALFDVLGITGEHFSDYCVGSMSAEDFMGRVLLAQAVAPVSALIPTIIEGNMVHGGRVEGYVQEKLSMLHNVAMFAVENNREICWG
jgi:hypothetical protein